MIGVAALLFTAAAGVTIARWLSLPAIPFLLLCGWILSLAGPAISEDVVAQALELGLVFLVFASGAELNPRRLQRYLKSTLTVALVQMGTTALLVYGVALWMGYGNTLSLYLAVAFSASSTLVATRQLRRLSQTQEPFARFSVRVLLAQDFLIVFLLAVLATLPGGVLEISYSVLKVLLLLVPALACQHWVLPWMVSRQRFAEETLLLFLLAALFLFLGAAAAFQLPLIVGAFFAGMMFSRFPANGVVRGQLASLTDFFLALFFATLAQLVAQPEWELLAKALGFAALVILVRPFLLTLLARRIGFDSRASVESGLLLSQVSEYALIVGLVGFQSGFFGSDDLALVALTTAITMTVTPFVANERMAAWLIHRRPRRRPQKENGWKDHVVMIGYGAGGKWVMKPLVEAGVEVVVVDDDPFVAEHLREEGLTCLLGDGSDPEVLAAAGANEARAVLASPRRTSDAIKVLRHVAGPPVLVRVFEAAEAEQVKQAGGIPILNSQAGADSFMEWLEKTGKLDEARTLAEKKTERRGS